MMSDTETGLEALSEWVEAVLPTFNAAAQLLGFEDYDHYYRYVQLASLAYTKPPV